MSDDTGPVRPQGEIVLYQPTQGDEPVRVLLEGETVWLTQNLLADLYQTSKQNISYHIKCIYEEGELDPDATVKKYLTVRQEGSRTVRRPIEHYNLDIIIAVGYRVKSPVATAFRQWATARLREYLVKGFTLNDERLTVMFLDQAEFRAQRRQNIHMHDWGAFLDKFLRDTELPVLDNAGSISHEAAIDWAHEQYDAFAERRRLDAEKQAEARYIEDLRTSARTLEGERKKKAPKKKQTKAKQTGRKRGSGKGGK